MSSLPCWQQRMLAAPLAGPKYLFSLQHEEVYFNEAAFGSLAFHLSKRWPYAALLCWGDLWPCRHSQCLSVCLWRCCWCWLSPASGSSWCGARSCSERPAGASSHRGRSLAVFWQKAAAFQLFFLQDPSSPVAGAGSGREVCCLRHHPCQALTEADLMKGRGNQTPV